MRALVLGAVLALASPAFAAVIEIPPQGSVQSGIFILSGWKCTGGVLTARFNGGPPIVVAYLQDRGDTQTVCGDRNNGYVYLLNYNDLGNGEHTLVMYDDGVAFASATFTVVTSGVAFRAGLVGAETVLLSDGRHAVVSWNTAKQGFDIIRFQGGTLIGVSLGAGLPFCEPPDASRAALAGGISSYFSNIGLLSRIVILCSISPQNPNAGFTLLASSVNAPFPSGTVYYDTEGFSILGAADFIDDFVIAHEYAHQVQFGQGIVLVDPLPELQADCLAGVYLGHVESTTNALDNDDLMTLVGVTCSLGDFGNVATHGTCEQRTIATVLGYTTAVEAYTAGTSFDALTLCTG